MNRAQIAGVVAMMLAIAMTVASGCSFPKFVAEGDAGCAATCNGQCVDTTSDHDNCGACGTVCGGEEVCANKTCALACKGGSTACGTSCVQLASDPLNCGGCGTTCAADKVCAMGMCTPCTGGTTQCGSACAEIATDSNNCGGCGVKCTGGDVCSNGKCALECVGGSSMCNGVCVTTDTDRSNCGACGHACAAGYACAAGSCTENCADGTTACDGHDAGGAAIVCANLQTDALNCGACGYACTGGFLCSNGHCSASCAPDLLTCNASDGGIGYCANSSNDPNNCGACGHTCGAGFVCAGGTCHNSCQAGLTSCNDNDAGASCVNLLTDKANCGACGGACGGAKTCSNGGCALPGYSYCTDGGAPIATFSDINNCGACGNVCPHQVCAGSKCMVACPAGYTANAAQRCQKVYSVLLSDVTGPTASVCGGQQSVVTTTYDSRTNAGESLQNAQYGFGWNDTGVADGLGGVTSVDVTFATAAAQGFTRNHYSSYLFNCNTMTMFAGFDPSSPLANLMEHVAFNNPTNTITVLTEPVATYQVCPASPTTAILPTLSGNQLSTYNLGGYNQILVTQQGAGVCFVPTNGFCSFSMPYTYQYDYCQAVVASGFAANPLWGTNVIAQVTVTY